MRKILVFLFSLLIGFGLFFWVIKLVSWQEIKRILFTFSGLEGMLVLGITFLIWLIGAWQYKFIFKSQGYNFSTWPIAEILSASFAISYLFPTTYFGGEAFKVYAFKRRFSSLTLEKNLAALIIEKILLATILLLFLILGAISFLSLNKLPLGKFWAIFFFLIGALALGLTIFYFKIFRKENILKWFLNFFKIKEIQIKNIAKEIFHFFDFQKLLIWKGLAIAFLRYFLILIRCLLLLFFLKGEINILIVLAVLFFSELAYLFPFPAKIGSSELSLVFLFGSLGLGESTGITFSFILRGAEILVTLLGLLFLLKLSIKFFLEKKLKI